jgi:hypothetical protein
VAEHAESLPNESFDAIDGLSGRGRRDRQSTGKAVEAVVPPGSVQSVHILINHYAISPHPSRPVTDVAVKWPSSILHVEEEPPHGVTHQ